MNTPGCTVHRRSPLHAPSRPSLPSRPAPQAAGFGGDDFEAAAEGGFGTPWGQPSVDERDFDARFDEWWKKMSAE